MVNTMVNDSVYHYRKKIIGLRLDTEEFEKLQQVLDRFGIGRIEKGDIVSDKIRSLIELLAISNPDNFKVEAKEVPSQNPFLEEYFTCPITKEAVKVKDLPCLEDPNFQCRHPLCLKNLRERLGK